MNNRKSVIRSALIWTFGERISAQIVTTLVTVVLARLLDPVYYGIISLVTVFIAICNVLVTSGMGTALVQKKEIEDSDYNTAFIIGFGIAMALYFVLFISAPSISVFYGMDELVLIVRVMALRLPLTSFNSIQQVRVQRAMAFKRFFVATLFGTVISGIVGVGMAVAGLGVWALVGQYLTNTTIDTFVLFYVEKWIPRFQFSRSRAKVIFSFGWKVLATELVYTLESDVRSLIIGKLFGPADLAYFDQGKKYPAVIVQNINASINKVMLPVYSKNQANLCEIKILLRKSIRLGIYFMAPLLIGFAAVSGTFVPFVLTEKWNYCIPYIRIFCFSYLTRPFESSCHQALLGLGKSNVVLKIMVAIHVMDIFLVLMVVFALQRVIFIAIGAILTTVVSVTCFSCQINKWIGYRVNEQIDDTLPILIVAVTMGFVVYFCGFIGMGYAHRLIFQILIGAITYFILSLLFKLEGSSYLMKILKNWSVALRKIDFRNL